MKMSRKGTFEKTVVSGANHHTAAQEQWAERHLWHIVTEIERHHKNSCGDSPQDNKKFLCWFTTGQQEVLVVVYHKTTRSSCGGSPQDNKKFL